MIQIGRGAIAPRVLVVSLIHDVENRSSMQAGIDRMYQSSENESLFIGIARTKKVRQATQRGGDSGYE